MPFFCIEGFFWVADTIEPYLCIVKRELAGKLQILSEFKRKESKIVVTDIYIYKLQTKKVSDMKKAFVVIIAVAGIVAQAMAKGEASEKVTIKTSKVCRMLVQTWADAYMKQHPQASIQVIDGSRSDGNQPDLVVESGKSEQSASIVGRYILLPVTSKDNPAADELLKRRLSQYDLSLLYFEQDPYETDDEEELSAKRKQLIERVTVYSGNRHGSAAESFARVLGYKTSDLRGKKIGGDDIYLLSAIEKDSTGITVSNVAYLYDTSSRALRADLLLLPLKASKEQRQALESRNLDQLLAVFEHDDSDILPAQNLLLEASGNLSLTAAYFAHWIATDGQQYNNQAGFLRAVSSSGDYGAVAQAN